MPVSKIFLCFLYFVFSQIVLARTLAAQCPTQCPVVSWKIQLLIIMRLFKISNNDIVWKPINNNWSDSCCSILAAGPCVFVIIIMLLVAERASTWSVLPGHARLYCSKLHCISQTAGAAESTYRCQWSEARLMIAKLESSQLNSPLPVVWFRIWCTQVLQRSGHGTRRRGWCRVPTPTSWMSSVLVRAAPVVFILCIMSCS